MKFADKIRPHVDRIGAVEAARICGVTDRTIRLWLRGEGNPNISKQAGALLLLSGKPARKSAASRSSDKKKGRLRLQKAVQERDALISHLRDVLKEIASYGDDHDGICPYGCDCPHVAKKALAATPETASAELAGSPNDEPDANGSVYARLRWWKDRCDELSDELAALREDKARLDWLDENASCVGGGSGATYSFKTTADVELGMLRAAIDAARKEATP